MGWDTFMDHIRKNPKQRQAVKDIKQHHTAEEHGGVFTHLAEAVEDHFKKASTILDGHPHKLTLSKLLLHKKDVLRES